MKINSNLPKIINFEESSYLETIYGEGRSI